MKKFNYKSSMQRKRNLKYGGYATVTTIILLVALVLGNVLFSLTGWRVDLTENELYTPSDETMQVLNSLEDDVTIYGLYNQGTEESEFNAPVIKLIEAYADLSDRVTFETVDPLTDPTFVNQFLMDDSASLENGSLIVVNNTTGKYRTVALSDLYEVTSDYSTLTRNVTGFSAEQALSAAIQYVCITDTPVLYQLQGHSEAVLTDDFIDYLSYTNFSVDTMNLVTDGIETLEADTATVILINNPRRDLSDSEYEILLNYMENGGRMLYLAASDMPELPNFERLLARFGLSIEGGLMIETSQDHYYSHPAYILPELSDESDISLYMQDEQNAYCLFTMPAAITLNEDRSNRITIQTVVSTSDGAVIKADGNEAYVQEEGDLTGPFNLCVTAEEQVYKESGNVATAKLAVVGSSDFIDIDNANSSPVVTGNYRLTALLCDYLQDSVSQLFISSKSLEEGSIQTTQADFIFYGLIFTVVVPLIIILAGVVIWVRRKHL